MKSADWLKQAEQQLSAANIGTARLDALVLLEDISGHNRAWLLAHPEHDLTKSEIAKLKNVLNRRTQHEPLAYVRGKTEFYGREFIITPAVLEPRPESETMIELLKQVVASSHEIPDRVGNDENEQSHVRIADVGCGSGALGITAALEVPKSTVTLIDIDSEALKVAKSNVDKFTLPIQTLKNNLVDAIASYFDTLLCNLPYVPDSHQINQAALHEPHIAIFGGMDGLELYRTLFDQLKIVDKRPLWILSESLPPQHHNLALIARSSDYVLEKTDDFIQVFVDARANDH